jgi:DNA polymerase-3 subunit epsilon
VDTGKDRIVQYCFIKKGKKDEVLTGLVNPGIPIPKGASDVHGITDDMVKDADTFNYHVNAISSFIEGCYLSGYNIRRFDVPLLVAEFKRHGYPEGDAIYKMDMIDAMVLYSQYRPKTLSAAYKDLTGEELKDAHDAEVDVAGTHCVIEKLAEKMCLGLDEMVEASTPEGFVDFAGKLKMNENGDICFAFGKWKDTPVQQEQSYAEWMLRSDFPEETKEIICGLLTGPAGRKARRFS